MGAAILESPAALSGMYSGSLRLTTSPVIERSAWSVRTFADVFGGETLLVLEFECAVRETGEIDDHAPGAEGRPEE